MDDVFATHPLGFVNQLFDCRLAFIKSLEPEYSRLSGLTASPGDMTDSTLLADRASLARNAASACYALATLRTAVNKHSKRSLEQTL